MTEPNWLPQIWPSDAPNIEDHYERMAPRQWPFGLFREDSEGVKDQKVIGVVFSWIRKITWWLTRCYFPRRDTEGYLLPSWEEVFDLPIGGTDLTLRANRIISSWRNRGTATEARIKSVFAAVMGTEDESDISISTVKPADAWSAAINGQRLDWPYDVTQDINGVWGSAQNYVWLVGDGGKIYLWSGAFLEKTSGTGTDLQDVWAPIDNHSFAWAVGGAVIEWNGTSWSAGPSGYPSGGTYYAIDGLNENFLVIAGTGDRVCRYDGSSWTNWNPGGGSENWRDVHIYAIDDIWACCEEGLVAHWDGISWNKEEVESTNELHGIRKMPNGHVYTVGTNGVAHEYDGSSWTSHTTGTTQNLLSLDGWQEDRLFAVGENGICVRYPGSGTTWDQYSLNCWHTLNAIWIDRASVYSFQVGQDGWVQRAPADDRSFAKNQTCLHVYSTNLDLDPDYTIGWEKTVLCQPAYGRFTVGRKKTCLASDETCGADISCAE